MNILYIADVPNWAFYKTGLALQKYGKNSYEIRFGRKSKYKKCWRNLNKFDLVLYPVDTRPDRVIKDHHIISTPLPGTDQYHYPHGYLPVRQECYAVDSKRVQDKIYQPINGKHLPPYKAYDDNSKKRGKKDYGPD